MSANKHQNYFDALNRLIKKQPTRVPKSSKINTRNVALEAGRNPSSIRKNRGMEKLINEIEKHKSPSKGKSLSEKTNAQKEKQRRLQSLLDVAHAKYLAATYELFQKGHFNPYSPPATVHKLPERDLAKRPLIDQDLK